MKRVFVIPIIAITIFLSHCNLIFAKRHSNNDDKLRLVLIINLRGNIQGCGCNPETSWDISGMLKKIKEAKQKIRSTKVFIVGNTYCDRSKNAYRSDYKKIIDNFSRLVDAKIIPGNQKKCPYNGDKIEEIAPFGKNIPFRFFYVGEKKGLDFIRLLNKKEGNETWILFTPNASLAKTIVRTNRVPLALFPIDQETKGPDVEVVGTSGSVGVPDASLVILDIIRPSADAVFVDRPYVRQRREIRILSFEKEELLEKIKHTKDSKTLLFLKDRLKRLNRRLKSLGSKNNISLPEHAVIFNIIPKKEISKATNIISQQIQKINREISKRSQKLFDPKVCRGEPFRGASSCKGCHKKIFRSYLKTPHKKAWDSLLKVNRTGEKECIGCHTLGMGKPGGFCSLPPPKKFTGVQCENCHGKISDINRPHGHVDDYKPVCMSCHSREKSPKFDFESWKKRVHPVD